MRSSSRHRAVGVLRLGGGGEDAAETGNGQAGPDGAPRSLRPTGRSAKLGKHAGEGFAALPAQADTDTDGDLD
ncbi:hypothetical protein AB0M92_38720 [Streptomyces sp. NPDC051582]|uniref:hypothetical protein n=1 Tax=Streptomyces sp. NPDC051582 TaxID=3155167 RepID=UPI00342A329C